jgi:uncharacterized protein YndB with AHSA1/START domain
MLSEREVVIERSFAGPRELLFAVWTEPAHLRRWWGPHGFTLSHCEVDLRPGGAWRFVMLGPDGSEYPLGGAYREVLPPERIVYTSTIDAPSMPKVEALVTVTFGEHGGRTMVTMTTRYATPADRDTMLRLQMAEGMGESLERLTAYLTTG